jgi:hypothetical protein
MLFISSATSDRSVYLFFTGRQKRGASSAGEYYRGKELVKR